MSSAVCITDVPGRGRALRAGRDISAGEVVFTDLPILLSCSQDAVASVCSGCLCILPVPGILLPTLSLISSRKAVFHTWYGKAVLLQATANVQAVKTHAFAPRRVHSAH